MVILLICSLIQALQGSSQRYEERFSSPVQEVDRYTVDVETVEHEEVTDSYPEYSTARSGNSQEHGKFLSGCFFGCSHFSTNSFLRKAPRGPMGDVVFPLRKVKKVMMKLEVLQTPMVCISVSLSRLCIVERLSQSWDAMYSRSPLLQKASKVNLPTEVGCSSFRCGIRLLTTNRLFFR